MSAWVAPHVENSMLRRWGWIPLVYFVVLWSYGSTLGLTDDEAYYWVLAQKPALGYAFHPPMVAWLIALFQSVLGWLFGFHSPALVRLPAALCASGTLALALSWVEQVSVGENPKMGRAALTVLALAGVFATAWMMVPDLPLIFALSAIFVLVWRVIATGRVSGVQWVSLALFMAMAELSKFSAVLGGFSALFALWRWAPANAFKRAALALAVGLGFAAIPIVIWNAQHEWGSILYQIRDRHGQSSFQALRYLRFWIVQLLLAGPPLLFFLAKLPGRLRSGGLPTQYVGAWVLPPLLVFGLQPAFSEFKPHWAFIAWLPASFELAREAARGACRRWVLAQIGYGLTLGVIGWALCQVPVIAWVAEKTQGVPADPRWDVGNDMFGWELLPAGVPAGVPVIGSRYQTASQAAFALGGLERVTLIPRDLKARDEWPELGVSEGIGPEWPKLTRPVLFVSDHRYSAGPEFKNAVCERLKRIERRRGAYLARWIDVYRCDPINAS